MGSRTCAAGLGLFILGLISTAIGATILPTNKNSGVGLMSFGVPSMAMGGILLFCGCCCDNENSKWQNQITEKTPLRMKELV